MRAQNHTSKLQMFVFNGRVEGSQHAQLKGSQVEGNMKALYLSAWTMLIEWSEADPFCSGCSRNVVLLRFHPQYLQWPTSSSPKYSLTRSFPPTSFANCLLAVFFHQV